MIALVIVIVLPGNWPEMIQEANMYQFPNWRVRPVSKLTGHVLDQGNPNC